MVRRVEVCRDVRSPRIGLGPLPEGAGRVVAVEMEVGSFDDDAARFHLVLARALVADARVTFLDEALEPPLPHAWEARGEDHVAMLPLGSTQDWTRRLTGLLGFDETRGLVSTRRAKRAARLFDSSYFDWWAQAQIGVLSSEGAAPPPIDAATLDTLLSDRWIEAVRSLASASVVGAMRPGVDGDLAGLFFLDPRRADAFLAAFASEAEAEGMTASEVSSEAFLRSRVPLGDPSG